MPKDFKASQVRTSKIIISGSESGKPALLIYSASDATDHVGNFQTDMLSNVGSDVYLFVSGNNGSILSGNRSSVTLFGGDVVVSGTFYAEKLVAEVDTTTNSDHHISGALYLSEKAADPDVDADQVVLYTKDDAGTSKLYFRNGVGITEIGGGGGAGTVTSGSFNEVANANAIPTTFVTTSSLSLAGNQGISYGVDNVGSDVFLYISGTRSTSTLKDDPSLVHSRSVFGGEIVVSGNLHAEGRLVGYSDIILNRADNPRNVLGGIGRTTDSNSITFFNSQSNTSGGTTKIQGRRSSGGSAIFDYLSFQGDGASGFGGAKTGHFLPKDGGESAAQSDLPRITFLSGGAGVSPDEIKAADVSIFFSGSSNSLDEGTRGSTLFGGDVATSGTLKITRNVAHNNQVGLMLNQAATDAGNAGSISQTFVAGFSGYSTGDGSELSIQKYGPNNTPQLGGPYANWVNAKSGSLIFSVGGTTSEYIGNQGIALTDRHQSNFLIATGSKTSGTGRVLILSGGAGVSSDEQSGADVNLFVSGSVGSKNSTTRGTSLFGGDVVISGTLYDGSGNTIGSGGGSITAASGSTSIGSVTQIDFTEAGILNNIGSGVAALTGTIGNPEDGSYADGLFTSFTPQTAIGVAIDKINEVLKFLAPSPAPGLDNINADSAEGITALLSFGASSPSGLPAGYTAVPATMPSGNDLSTADINDSYTVVTSSGGDLRLAIFADVGQTITGELNSDVAASDYNGGAIVNHVADSFGDADQGELQLWVNNTQVTFNAKAGSPNSVDLTDGTVGAGNPGSGTDGTFVNSNGTGFIQLSTTGSARTQSDTEFPLFKHRTGKFSISTADQVKGYNYAVVKHVIGSTTKTTNFVEWIRDADGTDGAAPIGANDPQIYINPLDGGTNRYRLSGVSYAVTGSGEYRVRVENFYRNVYAQNSITNTISNSSIGSTSPSTVPTINFGGGEDHTKSINVTSSFATTTATMLGDTVLARIASLNHPTKTGLTNAGSSISGKFLIYSGSVSTNTNEYFEHEGYRLRSGSYANQSDVTGPSGAWVNTEGLDGNPGLFGGHDDGLQYYNGVLTSPTNTLNGGDFRNNTDGGSYFGQDPAGVDYSYSNPNYSSLSGLRTFYRKVQNTTSDPITNFRIQFNAGTTTIPTIVAEGATLDSQKMKVFARLPGEVGSGWLDLGTEFSLGDTSNRAGGRATSTLYVDGSPVNYFTFGTGSCAANDYFVIKIEADASLTRDIGGITFQVPGVADTYVEAPIIEAIDSAVVGVAAKLSFGSSRPLSGYTSVGTAASGSAIDINENFPTNSTGTDFIRYGVLNGTTSITGTLNHNVSANGNNFTADAFTSNPANSQVRLILNGVVQHTLILSESAFTGTEKTSQSGFQNISAAVNPTDGTGVVPDYSKWYRTGQYVIGHSDMVNGWNYAKVEHYNGTGWTGSNYIQWVRDADTTALTITNTAFGVFEETNNQGVYHQSGVKYFQDPKGFFKSQVNHAYSNVYSGDADAITINSEPLVSSNLNAASFTQITGSSTALGGASSRQAALPALDTSLLYPTTGSLFVTGTMTFKHSTSLPGGGVIGGTSYNAAASISVKHPINGTQNSGIIYVGDINKKFLVFSGSVGSSNAYVTERFGREDFRIVSGNYTAQSDIPGGSWDPSKDMNNSSNTNYYNGMLIYNGKLISPINTNLEGNGDFRSHDDGGSGNLVAPVGNVNYSSLPTVSSSHRYYYRSFENNTSNNVFDVDVKLYGDATLVGRQGALSGSLGSNKNIYVEGKIPGKTGWLDLGAPTLGVGNIADGDAGRDGDADQTVDGAGATNVLTFNGQTVNGTGTGAEKIVLKITSHKDWTGYISQIDITY